MPDWQLRPTAPDLEASYRADGFWRDETLASFLTRCVERRPDHRVKLWSRTHPFDGTIAQIHDAARRLAATLRARGVGEGDVVSYQMPNHVEALIALWAIALRGAVSVPVVHFYGPKELGFILASTDVRAHITAASWGHLDYLATVDGLRADVPALETVVVSEASAPLPYWATSFDAAMDTDPLAPTDSSDPNAPAVVAYTSGTTSDPKGVIHSHNSLLAEVAQLSRLQEPGGRPLIMGAPLSHAIGMLGGLLSPLWRGVDVHIADGWEPAFILEAMLEERVSAGSGATYFFTSLLDHPDLSADHVELMNVIGLGGSPVPSAVGDRARDLGISVTRSYGCTELPSVTGSRPGDPHERRCHTDGVPMPGVELRLLDASGAPVGVGEPGEIVARGPERFCGYTDTDLTDRTLDGDGWYHTGDVGILDETGALTITDRLSDVIIRGGENISAAEVEEELMRIPGLAEVAVVAAPDARLGEHACAFLRSQQGADPIDLATIRSHLEQAGLARQKWPEEVRAVEDLPRTPSGKVKKFELRAQLREQAELD